MNPQTNMLRFTLLPLLLLSIMFSMTCKGQTFQYSRGWTNGKRGGIAISNSNNNHHFRREEENIPEILETQQDGVDKRLERCLLQFQHFLKNPLFHHAATASASYGLNPSNGNQNNDSNNNNNNNNPLYGRNHHQSNEMLEELGNSVDSNDYVRH
ncbi:pro-corazonin [Glossina fuscipes]|uniref:Pro-corazonin n=2 Tax=Nemorhina TaxID=44051 RepID=A0A8U0WG79_9MUSC|nr:pro-corazonin [Glossina fuscipes]